MTIYSLYIFDRYVHGHRFLHRNHTHLSTSPQTQTHSANTHPGTATASTTTTGSTAPNVQSVPTKAARTSRASHTPFRPHHPRPRPRHRPQRPARPSLARATHSPLPLASSSRSATPARHSPLAHRRPRRHPPPRVLVLRRAQARVCHLMKRPSWCTASSSLCGIWSSVYRGGASLKSSHVPSPLSPCHLFIFIVHRVSRMQGRVVCQLSYVDVQAAPLRNGLWLPLRHVKRSQRRLVALRHAHHLHRPFPRVRRSKSPRPHGLA